MLPSILGSTISHHNRQRSRNISGGRLGPQHQYTPVYDKYFFGGKKLHRNRHSSGSGSDSDVQSIYDQNQPYIPLRPRSADPSPRKTASRIESLREMHGGPLIASAPMRSSSGFLPSHSHLIGGSTSNLPMIQRDSHPHQRNFYSSQTPYKVGNPQAVVPFNTSMDYNSRTLC